MLVATGNRCAAGRPAANKASLLSSELALAHWETTRPVIMSVLSLGASFGALVWIVQEGHLAGLLGPSSCPPP